ncbi:MAG: Transporter [Sedimentibacter sp.]|jgi:drug/metabolite transporter (DMT)-like permease|nr:Transporter [Sedimentibacter sp.]
MNNGTKSILFMLFSAFTFSCMQIIVKLLPAIPLMEKVFFRNFISLLISFIILKKNNLSYFGNKENRKYLFFRYLFGFTGIILFFYATTNMLATDAAILNKLSPVFVIILAHCFLKEKINKSKIIVLIISIFGALLVIKPQFNSSILPAAAGFVSAILSGAAYVFITKIGTKESIYTTVFYFSFFSSISCIPFFFISFTAPDLYETIMLIFLGFLAAVGQIALTSAYNGCEASEVSIYDYSNIIFSTLLAYVFLSEIPDMLSILGGLLIISASLILFLNTKR